jgi:putative nucleotidyltransferase with HDIG domain
LWPWLEEVVRVVAERGKPEFVGDEPPVLLLAVPLTGPQAARWVALGAFLMQPVDTADDLSGAELLLSRTRAELLDWAGCRDTWPAAPLARLAKAVTAKLAGDGQIEQLNHELEVVSAGIAETFEEITLLHHLASNLRLSASDADLGRIALDGLLEVLPIEGVAILYLPSGNANTVTDTPPAAPFLVSAGRELLDGAMFEDLLAVCRPAVGSVPLVLNPGPEDEFSQRFPEVRSLILASLTEGENLFGWLIAFNRVDGGELGTIEANLLSSVGAILGIHAGNVQLYQQQEEFLTEVVRALSSAIDAKDPYTCGHSDRVARVAVRLARELGFDGDPLKTIYMAGLLHDIGKIGVDDKVLRKPGRLTDEEYEHIKRHPELGYKILKDLKGLADVLPSVLHHHERWDGGGYPHELAAEEIPLFARIISVADAYDAMASDRPYRSGMPDERLHAIFESGAGTQWDQRVVEAFLGIQDEIRAISQQEREQLKIDRPLGWVTHAVRPANPGPQKRGRNH